MLLFDDIFDKNYTVSNTYNKRNSAITDLLPLFLRWAHKANTKIWFLTWNHDMFTCNWSACSTSLYTMGQVCVEWWLLMVGFRLCIFPFVCNGKDIEIHIYVKEETCFNLWCDASIGIVYLNVRRYSFMLRRLLRMNIHKCVYDYINCC